MPKKNLVLIYEHLFKEGVMVAKKDTHAPKHPELDVPNLQVGTNERTNEHTGRRAVRGCRSKSQDFLRQAKQSRIVEREALI